MDRAYQVSFITFIRGSEIVSIQSGVILHTIRHARLYKEKIVWSCGEPSVNILPMKGRKSALFYFR